MDYQVALLIFGILLLILGLIGKVKAKELEVGTDSPFARAVIGVIGAIMITLSILTTYAHLLPSETESSAADLKQTETTQVTDAANEASEQTSEDSPDPSIVRRIQSRLLDMNFDSGTVDGTLGAKTLSAMAAFRREYGGNFSLAANQDFLDKLDRARADGFSNLVCEERTEQENQCKTVVKQRKVVGTEVKTEYVEGVMPCYYSIPAFCNVYGCDFGAIENMCESDSKGKMIVRNACKAQHGGTLSDYSVSCDCGPTSCGCELSGDCDYESETVSFEPYEEENCSSVPQSVRECYCRAPDVCIK